MSAKTSCRRRKSEKSTHTITHDFISPTHYNNLTDSLKYLFVFNVIKDRQNRRWEPRCTIDIEKRTSIFTIISIDDFKKKTTMTEENDYTIPFIHLSVSDLNGCYAANTSLYGEEIEGSSSTYTYQFNNLWPTLQIKPSFHVGRSIHLSFQVQLTFKY